MLKMFTRYYQGVIVLRYRYVAGAGVSPHARDHYHAGGHYLRLHVHTARGGRHHAVRNHARRLHKGWLEVSRAAPSGGGAVVRRFPNRPNQPHELSGRGDRLAGLPPAASKRADSRKAGLAMIYKFDGVSNPGNTAADSTSAHQFHPVGPCRSAQRKQTTKCRRVKERP